MDPIFNIHSYTPGKVAETYRVADFHSEEEAIRAVEEAGGGRVVKFAQYENLPGALPKIRKSSIWMKTFQDGKWDQPNIHG